MSSRNALRLLAVAIIALVPLAVLGRHERANANAHEQGGISSVAAQTSGRQPSSYRLTLYADCLIYSIGADPYALELCFDRRGRAVEAIDRHPRNATRFWSVRYDPSLSPVRRSPRALFDQLVAAGAFPPDHPFTGVLPLSRDVSALGTGGDTGPIPFGTSPVSVSR